MNDNNYIEREQLTQKSKKPAFEITTILAFATAIWVASIYYHEMGFFSRYGIPIDFIEVELYKNIHILFWFLVLIFLVIFLLNYLVEIYTWIKNYLHKKFPLISRLSENYFALILIIEFIFIGIVLYFLTVNVLGILEHMELSVLYMTFIFSSLIGIFENRLIPSFYIQRIKNEIKTFTFVVPLSCLVCFVMFMIGRWGIGLSGTFTRVNEKNTFLLRSYSTHTIYGIHDTSTKKIGSFIISRGKDDADTIQVHKN